MKVEAVPQEGNATLGGHRKLMYARDASGRTVGVGSRGWEAEEIVTSHAVDAIAAQAGRARERVLAGEASPLEYWMYERRMDVALLAQTSGFWQWRVRRHLRPRVFAALGPRQLARYAEALGLSVAQLQGLP
ncbi:MAG: hypothetical protein J7549_01670 [Variovorax sp.]|nr:hypothetical protein [Variovorax sp.]